jgi:flagellar hook assembly protein FlgD
MTLMQNYPNPFNPSTHISFSLPQTQHVRLSIYNMRGQLVKTLVNEKLKAGQNTLTWDGKDNRGNPVATGIYSYRIQSNGQSISRKMMLMK